MAGMRVAADAVVLGTSPFGTSSWSNQVEILDGSGLYVQLDVAGTVSISHITLMLGVAGLEPSRELEVRADGPPHADRL